MPAYYRERRLPEHVLGHMPGVLAPPSRADPLTESPEPTIRRDLSVLAIVSSVAFFSCARTAHSGARPPSPEAIARPGFSLFDYAPPASMQDVALGLP